MALITPLAIVAIDDNRRLLTSLELLLVTLGHTVRTAATGEEGVCLVRESPADLVICDIDLRGPVNGYSVARTLRLYKSLRPTFLAALTGNSQQHDREKSAAAGFNRHVAKPASLNDIEMLVADARLYCLRNARRGPLRPAGVAQVPAA